MVGLQTIISNVAAARRLYLDELGSPSADQATFKSSAIEWCLTEITEHITIAEQVGINGM